MQSSLKFFEPAKKFSFITKPDYHLLFVALVPLLLFFANTEWLFPYGNPTDSWLNNSYFHNYGSSNIIDTGILYNYKATRLSWILKGVIAHKLLPPLYAYLTLNLLVLFFSILAFYFITKELFNKYIAFFGTLSFATYSQFHSIISFEWDYHTHDSILNILLTLLFLTLAAKRQKFKTLLFFSGVFLASALQSPYCVAYLPMVVGWYLFLNRQNARHPLLSSISWVILGGLAITLVYCAVSYSVGGPFFYYWPQIEFSIFWGESGKFQQNYWVPVLTALKVGRGVALPFFVIILLIFSLCNTKFYQKAQYRQSMLLCSCSLFWCFLIHMVGQWRGHPFLSDDHFIISLSPMAFLGVTTLYSSFIQKLEIKQINIINCLAFLIGCAALIFSNSMLKIMNWASFKSIKILGSKFNFFLTIPVLKPLLPIFCFMLLLIPFILLRRRIKNIFPALLLIVTIPTYNMSNNSIPLQLYDVNFKCGYLKDQYIAVMDIYKKVREFDPKHETRLWFNSYERTSHPSKECSNENLSAVYGHPVITLGALYGALWGTLCRFYDQNYHLYYSNTPIPDINNLKKHLPERYKSLALDEKINMQVLSGLSALDSGVLGGYMYTKSFSEIPDASFWKMVLPEHFKLVILSHSLNEHQTALDTLDKSGFKMDIKEQYQVKQGVISFYATLGEMKKKISLANQNEP